jgi:preprotein translocase subunit SecG
MFTFLLVLQGLVAAALIGVILMQKSEGGGLGVGGSPTGFLSARGAGDFLTRSTAILATLFVGLSIALAVIASVNHRANQIDADAANRIAVPPAGGAPALPAAPGGVPIAPTGALPAPAAGGVAADPLAGAAAAPAEPQGVPLQQ